MNQELKTVSRDKKVFHIFLTISFISMALILGGCGKSPSFLSQEKGKEIELSSGNKTLVFKSTKKVSGSYKVLSIELAKQNIEKENGVIVNFWGIPSSQVSGSTFSRSDLNKGKMFNFIPANEQVKATLLRLAKNKKACNKELKLSGDHVVKIKEAGKSCSLDLGFFYLRSVDGSWD